MREDSRKCVRGRSLAYRIRKCATCLRPGGGDREIDPGFGKEVTGSLLCRTMQTCGAASLVIWGGRHYIL